MRLLLTSNGICNPTLVQAFRELLGKPATQSRVVFVPTAANLDSGDKSWLIDDMHRVKEMQWAQIDVVDVAVTSEAPRELWWPSFDEADAIVVGGGNPLYLSYWLQRSGLFDELQRLVETKLYVGCSSGAIVTGSTMGARGGAVPEYRKVAIGNQSSEATLSLFDGCFRAHYQDDYYRDINESDMQQLAVEIATTVYAADDESALSIIDGEITPVGEGEVRRFDA